MTETKRQETSKPLAQRLKERAAIRRMEDRLDDAELFDEAALALATTPETLQPASNERLSDTNLRNIRSWAENHLEFSSDDSGPRMIAEAMDELLMRRRAAETPEQLLSGLTEAQRELATENLLTIIDVSSALEKKTPKELVDLVLGELAAMDVSSVQELLIEELCTRVHPNWCNEDPTSEKAKVVPSICGKPMPDGKGAGQCINPPGHEGDCDDMPF